MTENKTRGTGTLALIWCGAAALVAPLYYEDQYFNMLQAKAHICNVALAVLLGGTLALWLVRCVSQHRLIPPSAPEPLDGVLLLFGALALLSTLCSPYPAESFWGMEGWCVGGYAMAGLSLACVLLPRMLPYRQNLWLPVLGVNLLVFACTVFHAAGVDVLGLHEDILPVQWFSYLSTIGNRNWFAGYLCLLVPLVAVFYLSATETASRIVCLIFLAPACLNLVLCASDSIYLGLGICMFFALPYVTATGERMMRSFVLVSLYGLSLLLFRYAPPFREMAATVKGLSRIAMDPRIALAVTAAGIALALLSRLFWDRLSPKGKRRITFLLEGLLLMAALAFLVYTLTHFNDKWGTNRGRTWRESWALYGSLPLAQKLLGVGPELLGLYYSELSGDFIRPILSAHSEPLQILLTNGALGLVCWGTVWGMLLARFFRQKLWGRDEIAFFLPLAAYGGQALVNGPQPLNAALLCLMVVCFRIHTREKTMPERA